MEHTVDTRKPVRGRLPFARVIFAAVLAVAVAGCTGCAAIQGAVGTGGSSGATSTWIADASSDALPAYERFDIDAFTALCESMVSAAGAGDTDRAFELFDKAKEQYGYLCTLGIVSYVTYCEDVENETAEQEEAYTANANVTCFDALCTAAHTLATGSLAESFRTHLGDDAVFAEFVEYEAMAQEEMDLYEQETELVNEYYGIIADTSPYTYEYGDRVYNLDMIDNEMALVMLGDEGYEAVYAGCMKALNEAAGAVYLKLVGVRTEIAKLNGYDDYAAYADAEMYARDYTASDLEPFRAAVQTYSASGAVPDTYELATGVSSYEAGAGKILDAVSKAAEKVSPYASESLSVMRAKGLSSIGADESRMDAGFTSQIFTPVAGAFMFDALYGNPCDLSDIAHELGHYTRMTRNGGDALQSAFGMQCLDLDEVNSTGLELLACRNLSDTLGQSQTRAFSAWLAGSALDTIVDGCVYDEWQRTVYRNPAMTLDEMNEAFRSTLAAYGLDASDASAYGWVQVHHNFDSPLYYISYATSYFATLQLWVMAESGDAGTAQAAKIWEQSIDCSIYAGFKEFCTGAGLANMADTAAVSTVLDQATTCIARASEEGSLAAA